MIKYHQKWSNSCCLSSLASYFHCIDDNRTVTYLVNIIEESLNLQTDKFKNRIHFANAIMTNRKKGEKNLRYNLKMWKKKDYFDILNGISEDVNLVQLMESLGNVNNAMSIVGHWIFGSNYNKALFLTQGSLNLIYSPSLDEEQVSTFRSVFYAVRYIWEPIHLKKGRTWYCQVRY